MKRKVAVAVILGLVVAWGAARVLSMRSDADTPEAAPALTRLGPYQAGMTLRQAFDSLPANAERTRLTLLLDNPHAWAARWRQLDATRESLDISYFILREDLFGAAFLGHLLKKAQEGVRIRLLLDAQGTVMSFTSPRGNDWLDTLANTGNIQVKIFRPLLRRYVQAVLTLNPVALVASEHDKIMVADGRTGMIGGRNISAEYFAHPEDMPKAFEDVDVTVAGKMAAERLIAAFEAQYRRDEARAVAQERIDLASYTEELLLAYRAMDAWLKGVPPEPQTDERIKALGLAWRTELAKYPRLRGILSRAAPAVDSQAETRFLDSRTRLAMREDVIGEGIARLSLSSRHAILVQSPYLVLSKKAVDMLADVGGRGVKILVLTNSPVSSDNALSQAFFLEQWPELLARVPNMRIYVTGRSRTVHTKLAVFDDQVSLVGTYNLDPVSMEINSEIMAAVWSNRFAKQTAQHPRALLARGAPLVYEYRIKRDAAGRALLDENGKPMVSFGPEDHADPAQWRKIQLYRNMLRAAEKIAGFSPLF